MSVAVEYLGFQTNGDSREYRLRSREGADLRDYTVGITHQAFASGRLRYQDGPAICYEKLQRELQAPEPSEARHFDVSEADLQAYQQVHAVPSKRRLAPPEPRPAPAAHDADGLAKERR